MSPAAGLTHQAGAPCRVHPRSTHGGEIPQRRPGMARGGAQTLAEWRVRQKTNPRTGTDADNRTRVTGA